MSIGISALLAAALAFIFSRLSARAERSIAASERKFARTTFPPFDSSLTQILKTHVRETADALDLVARAIDTYLLKRSMDISLDEEGSFIEEPWVVALTGMKLSPLTVTTSNEGKRFTSNLTKQLSRYSDRINKLNTSLRKFSLIGRVKTSFSQPDGEAVDEYRKKLKEERNFKSDTDLVDSESFQKRVKEAREEVERAAQEVKELNSTLPITLAEIRELTHDL